MDQGKSAQVARNLTHQLLQQVSDVEPTTENLKAIYPLLLEQGMELREQRRMRTTIATPWATNHIMDRTVCRRRPHGALYLFLSPRLQSAIGTDWHGCAPDCTQFVFGHPIRKPFLRGSPRGIGTLPDGFGDF